jgi:small conductance mechanosensitive channel
MIGPINTSDITNITRLSETVVINFFKYFWDFIVIGFILLIGYIVIKLITSRIKHFFEKAGVDKAAETFLNSIIKFIGWLIVLGVILKYIGFDLTGVVAGLGIGGIIAGFAFKDTLENMIAGIFILYYKPFKIGDYVEVGGDVSGTVKEINIASCILITPDKIKVVVPNAKIWGNYIKNYTAVDVRKFFDIKIGISYEDDINKAMNVIKKIMEKDERILKEPKPEIVVTDLSDSAVVLSVRPCVKTKDYWPVKHDLLKAIKEEFDKNGITIPYPQRVVYVKTERGKGNKKKIK